MYSHGRSLVKKYENQPFVLLGVNTDQDPNAINQLCEKEQLTWRSWWDGGGTHGPISTAWQISSFPTIYVLDANGIIRFKGLPAWQLDKAVDTLLGEMRTTTPSEL